ncbi:MAG: hypothetical protein ACP5M4_15135 [Acidobacteriaceae bacterium]
MVPAFASAQYVVRSETVEQLADLQPKVFRCFEAGGLATGAKVEIRGGNKPYAAVLHNTIMAELFARNSADLGREFKPLGELETRPSGSTDMGNVSRVIPSIHPMIGIDSLPAVNHQPEFTAHCITEDADKTLIDGALAMAWTCIDMATDKGTRESLIAAR